MARRGTSRGNGRCKTQAPARVGAEKAPFARGAAAQRPPESGRRSGELDPVRYGDWEVKGMATDF